MNKNLYFVGMTSIFELLISHEKDAPLYFRLDGRKSAEFMESLEKNGRFAFPM